MSATTLALVGRSSRPSFLILTPACLSLGVATAVIETGGNIHLFSVILILIAGIAAHVSVNALNEYTDFKNGLDLKTEKTPFSGGSGLLPSYPQLATAVLLLGSFALLLLVFIGLYFMLKHGPFLVLVGMIGVLIIVSYSRLIVRSPLLSLITPGLGFGPLMILGTNYVLTGQISIAAGLASLVPFFLVNNLLLLNQYPDVEADQQVGRRNYPILIGRRNSTHLYLAFILLGFASIPLGVVMHLFPLMSLIVLVLLLPALISARDAYRHADHIPALSRAMGLNVVVNIFAPALLAVTLVI